MRPHPPPTAPPTAPGARAGGRPTLITAVIHP